MNREEMLLRLSAGTYDVVLCDLREEGGGTVFVFNGFCSFRGGESSIGVSGSVRDESSNS